LHKIDTHYYLYDKEIVYLEIIDKDEEGFGKIVCTHLMRYRVWPVIRYEIGDIGKLIIITYQSII